jgi:hypothetical protein
MQLACAPDDEKRMPAGTRSGREADARWYSIRLRPAPAIVEIQHHLEHVIDVIALVHRDAMGDYESAT